MRIRVTMIIEAPDDYNYGEVEDTILNAVDEDGTCEVIEFVDMEDF